jgi:hypothetical protein
VMGREFGVSLQTRSLRLGRHVGGAG